MTRDASGFPSGPRANARALLALSFGALFFAGCADVCDDARDKLDSCAHEIDQAVEQYGDHGLAITIEDGTCSGMNGCLAVCVNSASCSALAYLRTNAGAATDPSRTPPADANALWHCTNACLGD
jgi:hypothetical protein